MCPSSPRAPRPWKRGGVVEAAPHRSNFRGGATVAEDTRFAARQRNPREPGQDASGTLSCPSTRENRVRMTLGGEGVKRHLPWANKALERHSSPFVTGPHESVVLLDLESVVLLNLAAGGFPAASPAWLRYVQVSGRDAFHTGPSSPIVPA